MGAQPSAGSFEIDVDDELVRTFRQQGFASIERITTDEEVAWLREVFDDLYARRSGGVPGGYFDLSRPYDADGDDRLPQVLFPERRVPDLLGTTYVANARRIAARLLDVDADALESWGHMISKPPHHGHATPWHQDESYWEPELVYHAVGVWMPLDDTDEQNGCLWFVPGSHRHPLHRHRHIGDDPRVHGLELHPGVEVDVSGAVPVPLAAGGASFHHPRTLHSAGPNRTSRRRRAFANEFQTAPRPNPDPDRRPWHEDGRRAWAERGSARADSRGATA